MNQAQIILIAFCCLFVLNVVAPSVFSYEQDYLVENNDVDEKESEEKSEQKEVLQVHFFMSYNLDFTGTGIAVGKPQYQYLMFLTDSCFPILTPPPDYSFLG